MMQARIFSLPAFWASLAALLAALGVSVPHELFDRIAELCAALAAIIGIIQAARVR